MPLLGSCVSVPCQSRDLLPCAHYHSAMMKMKMIKMMIVLRKMKQHSYKAGPMSARLRVQMKTMVLPMGTMMMMMMTTTLIILAMVHDYGHLFLDHHSHDYLDNSREC